MLPTREGRANMAQPWLPVSQIRTRRLYQDIALQRLNSRQGTGKISSMRKLGQWTPLLRQCQQASDIQAIFSIDTTRTRTGDTHQAHIESLLFLEPLTPRQQQPGQSLPHHAKAH